MYALRTYFFILGAFWAVSWVEYINYITIVEIFLHAFGTYKLKLRRDCFWPFWLAIAFAKWPILPLSKSCHSLNIKWLLKLFFSLIIYMKKFLQFDSLGAVQFFSKTVQKRVNWVQKEETNLAFWLVND